MGEILLVIFSCFAALGLVYLLGCRRVERRNGGLVDNGWPKPKGSAARWDDPPVDLDD